MYHNFKVYVKNTTKEFYKEKQNLPRFTENFSIDYWIIINISFNNAFSVTPCKESIKNWSAKCAILLYSCKRWKFILTSV